MNRVGCCFVCAIALAGGVSGCGKGNSGAASAPAAAPAVPVKAAPQTPLAEKKEDLGSDVAWTPAWDAFIEQSLPADLLSEKAARAVRMYCPAFAQEPEADQRAFWAYTFQALAAAEAGLKPTADVHHTERAVAVRDTVTHRASRQEGLLQLKYEDAQRYGCDFDFEADRRLPEKSAERTILQPQKNLACGMKIMENQIITQGKPLVVRSSYWATLQPGTKSYRVFAKQMANVPEACGLHRKVPGRPGRRGTRHMAAGE